MEKYDCKNCEHNNTGTVFKPSKYCSRCTVDSKNISGKPSLYREKQTEEKRK